MPTNESGIDSDLIRGHIDTIILKALFEGDKYGYEICKEVEERSGGTYELKQPTLYSCLKRLESQKLISSYWTDSEIGGKRHYYKLTDLGKETYQKNQDDWNRSRVIIDSLISSGEKPQFIISPESSKEIDNLQKQVEDLKKQLENEKQNKPEPEEKIVYVPVSNENLSASENEEKVFSTIETDQTDSFIPWAFADDKSEQENEKNEDVSDFAPASENFEESIEDENDDINKPVLNEDAVASSAVDYETDLQSSGVQPSVEQDGEQTVKYVQLSDNFVARVASNGEILSVEKTPLKNQEIDNETAENQEIDEKQEEDSPAQASVFEETNENLVFDEPENEQNQEQSDDDVDIMALLGHTAPAQIERTEKELLETSKEEQLLISKEERPQLESSKTQPAYEESSSPFVFKIDDDFDANESFFDAQEKQTDAFYSAPVEKIVGKEEQFEDEKHSLDFDFEKFKENHMDKDLKDEIEEESVSENNVESPVQEEDEISSNAPVYHDFGAVRKNYDEADLTAYNPDAIYENPDKVQEEPQTHYSLFDDEDLLENNDEEFDSHSEDFSQDNVQEKSNVWEENENDNETDETSYQDKTMPFYEATDGYDSMKTNYTDEVYKEKLSSLMSYQANDGARENYKILTAPKDFKELKAEFEEEGIIVKPHTKMVKESKSTRSYIESNKLNVVNSWTAYGIVAFFVTLTFLIMNNYKASFSTFDFSAKYFLIGLAILMVVPIIYSVIYFVNPYKKKPARYAYRIYILFALLLTIQLLIIIYSINLQLGFYSIHQENYNHLYWIVPTILSTYPLIDAILHGVYFGSRNFHI